MRVVATEAANKVGRANTVVGISVQPDAANIQCSVCISVEMLSTAVALFHAPAFFTSVKDILQLLRDAGMEARVAFLRRSLLVLWNDSAYITKCVVQVA